MTNICHNIGVRERFNCDKYSLWERFGWLYVTLGDFFFKNTTINIVSLLTFRPFQIFEFY